MEKRLSYIFRTKNIMKLTKTIVKSFYWVVQVTSNLKTLKEPVYCLRVVKFWPTSDIQISITLAIFWECCETALLRNSHKSLKRSHHSQKSHPLRNNGPLKKWKICVFWWLFLHNKNCWRFEFLTFGQRFIFEKWS